MKVASETRCLHSSLYSRSSYSLVTLGLSPQYKLSDFHFYRPQKVMFSQVFVCPRGWETLCTGVSVRETTPPPAYGKERAVRILLECILVTPWIQSGEYSAMRLMSFLWHTRRTSISMVLGHCSDHRNKMSM